MLTQNIDRRFSPNRRKTLVEAIIHFDGQSMKMFIVDVSYDGLKLAVPNNIAVGTAVMVNLPDAQFPAIVHWCRKGFAGLHLLERLDSKTLKTLESANDELADFR